MRTATICTVLVAVFILWYASLDRYRRYVIHEPLPEYDIIIIGGGTAGVVLANRLSSANQSVLLLEAGGSDDVLLTKLPQLMFLAYFSPSLSWLYKSESGEILPSGKCIGGSSSVNALMWTRGNKDDYDLWASQYGCSKWSYDHVLPYFIKSEHVTFPSQSHRGTEGSIFVQNASENLIRAAKDIIQSAKNAFNFTDSISDYNDVNFEEGITSAQHNIYMGRRHSVTQAYLTDQVLSRKNLHVSLHSRVTKLLIDENRSVYGVQYQDRNGNLVQVKAKHETILSAGALKSPQILMLSGVGPKKHLEEMGIPVIHDLASVGRNLQDHMGPNISFTIDYPTLFGEVNFRQIWNSLYHRKGVFAGGLIQLIGFLKTKYATPILTKTVADIQLFFINGVFTLDFSKMIKYPNAFGTKILLLRPKSRGYIELKSSNPLMEPSIHLNYFSDPDSLDMKRLIEAVHLVKSIMKYPPLVDHNVTQIDNHHNDTMQLILDSVESIYHFSGTCAMGTNVETSVVNPEDLTVHGIQNLRVVDASIMPTIIGANTHATVVMIAEKAADIILKKQQ
jgi:choline dehydrogenase